MTGDGICEKCQGQLLYGKHVNSKPCVPPQEDRPDDLPTVTVYPPSTCPPCGGTGRSSSYPCAACQGTGTTIVGPA